MDNDRLFDHAVAITKAHAKATVAAYRAVTRNYLLWINDSVLGVYDAPEKARQELQTVLRTPGFAKATWTEAGSDHWIGYLEDGSKIVVRVDGRVVG